VIPSKKQRDEWRKFADNTQIISTADKRIMVQASEFIALLDAVDELELENRGLRELIDWHRRMNEEYP